jgi:transcriptional regulator with PAS, ATPase and Fis domain
VTVLLTGESGTGKELAARALHDESTRRRGPFIAVNCSAIPGELIESELFGHVRGAFTGADRDRIGVFEAASGGTLFLDEIGELSEAAQAKLLRALEEQRVTRVGATTATNVDVRIVAATNRNLELMVRERTFREDLLYRVAVVQIALPPLRERREDIMALTAHFIAHFAQRHSVAPRAIGELARRTLLACDWPGNVRELRNTIERALVLAEGDEIDVADLPASVSGSTTALRPAEAVLAELPFADARQRAFEAFDRSFLNAALERHGNISATARALGLHRQSLQKLLRRLGISDPT